jgi:hypothetical protein
MKQFDYMWFELRYGDVNEQLKKLKALGKQGWDVAATRDNLSMALLKREITSEPAQAQTAQQTRPRNQYEYDPGP